jgi:anti-sigma B factor antagonist
MVQDTAIVRARLIGTTIDCQVSGRGTMRETPAFRRFVETALDSGSTAIRIELSDCTYLDSTFLGTLIYLKRALDRKGGEFSLVTPSPPCCELLRQTCLDRVLPIVTGEPSADGPGWTELESDSDGYAFRRTVVEAHQELADLPGPTGEVFREVARELTDQWESHNKRPADP